MALSLSLFIYLSTIVSFHLYNCLHFHFLVFHLQVHLGLCLPSSLSFISICLPLFIPVYTVISISIFLYPSPSLYHPFISIPLFYLYPSQPLLSSQFSSFLIYPSTFIISFFMSVCRLRLPPSSSVYLATSIFFSLFLQLFHSTSTSITLFISIYLLICTKTSLLFICMSLSSTTSASVSLFFSYHLSFFRPLPYFLYLHPSFNLELLSSLIFIYLSTFALIPFPSSIFPPLSLHLIFYIHLPQSFSPLCISLYLYLLSSSPLSFHLPPPRSLSSFI